MTVGGSAKSVFLIAPEIVSIVPQVIRPLHGATIHLAIFLTGAHATEDGTGLYVREAGAQREYGTRPRLADAKKGASIRWPAGVRM